MVSTFRLLVLAVLFYLGWVLLSEAETQAHLESPDQSKVVLLYLATASVGVGIAALIATMVVPALGNFIGNRIFNPGGELALDPHTEATAKVARDVLTQVAETMEGTKYARNAEHRVQEIDRAMALGGRAAGQLEDADEEPS